MFEQMFEIEYVEKLNMEPTRIKASSFQFLFDFRYQAPRLVFLDWSYTPVFTHDGLPDIIKSIHFIQEGNTHENNNAAVIVEDGSGDAHIKSATD